MPSELTKEKTCENNTERTAYGFTSVVLYVCEKVLRVSVPLFLCMRLSTEWVTLSRTNL